MGEGEELEEFSDIHKLQEFGVGAGAWRSTRAPCVLCALGMRRVHSVRAAAVSPCRHMHGCPCVRPCNAADIKKAKEGGFHTCESLVMCCKKVGEPGWAAPCMGGVLPVHGARCTIGA